MNGGVPKFMLALVPPMAMGVPVTLSPVAVSTA